ncbi:MAG: hypothetical protein H6850_00630 [Alphaproteobacteria bacterium]|nr:MAG: hypothetical protein H6850_00630 [Alphaproteobacteria bacterium]
MKAANIHLSNSFEWSDIYKAAFLKYLEKGGFFVWGGVLDRLAPTLIKFHSVEHFLSEINDPQTCRIFANQNSEA